MSFTPTSGSSTVDSCFNPFWECFPSGEFRFLPGEPVRTDAGRFMTSGDRKSMGDVMMKLLGNTACILYIIYIVLCVCIYIYIILYIYYIYMYYILYYIYMYFTVFWEIPVFGSSTHWVNDSAMEIWFMVVSRKGGDHRYIYIYTRRWPKMVVILNSFKIRTFSHWNPW